MNNSVKVQLACNAMATRFEFVLCGEDEWSLRAAGEEAIREIQRIEDKLSFFRHHSIISRLNTSAGHEPVVINAEIFSFLDQALKLSEKTESAFDPTVGPLMKAWGFMKGSGQVPDDEQIQEALKCTGTHLVLLDHNARSVRFRKPGVMLDPGAIGKGYALDQVALLLRETGVEHALIHGGTSTVMGWGQPPEGEAWKVAVRDPERGPGEPGEFPEILLLDNQALSVSTVWGKTIEVDGKTLGHVIDPRTGRPVEGALLAVCVANNATTADACSTAMLVLGKDTPSVLANISDVSRFSVLLNNRKTITSEVESG